MEYLVLFFTDDWKAPGLEIDENGLFHGKSGPAAIKRIEREMMGGNGIAQPALFEWTVEMIRQLSDRTGRFPKQKPESEQSISEAETKLTS